MIHIPLSSIKRIILCSESELKKSALQEAVKTFPWLNDVQLEFKDSQPSVNPKQPVNSGHQCATNRINHLGTDVQNENTLVIAIESEIRAYKGEGDKEIVDDVAHVVITRNGFSVSSISSAIPVPVEYYEQAKKASDPENPNKTLGLTITAGAMIEKAHPEVKANNWMADPRFGGIDRSKQIVEAVKDALKKVYICSLVALYNDFPKPGVMFREIQPVLSDPTGFRYISETLKYAICSKGWDKKANKIIGFDARGFIYGTQLAMQLGLGLVMLRKKGKLAGKVITINYKTEYSDDVLEVAADSVKQGDKFILVDDVIATGGTFKAGIDALHQLGIGEVVGCVVVMKVEALVAQATAKLAPVEFACVI